MDLLKTILTHHQGERYRFNRRAGFFLILCMVAFGVLVARLFYLQVLHYDDYAKLSRDNRIKIELLPPIRGALLDRTGKPIATNRPVFDLAIDSDAPGNMHLLVDALVKEFSISEQEVKDFYQSYFVSNPRLSYPIIIKSDLSTDELMRFSAMRSRFVGARIEHDWQRSYEEGEALSPVIGYVGRIDKSDVSDADRAKYYGIDYIGKQGIERSYEHLLRGELGYRELEVTSRGQKLKTISTVHPTRGLDIQLSVESELQSFAYYLFGGRAGALVSIDPRNGDVLSLVSSPTYLNSLFVTRLDYETYNRYLSTNALFNRAIGGLYPPASTIKPMLAYGALHSGITTSDDTVNCRGTYSIPDLKRRWYRPFRDWLRSGHGTIAMSRAISESCDVYFYDLAYQAKIAGIHKTLSWFHFGKTVLPDLRGEVSGTLPSDEWKRQQIKAPWLPGDTINVGIGQGYLQTTILQLAHATAIIANRGQVVQPRLVVREGYAGNVLKDKPVEVVRAGDESKRALFDPVIAGMAGVIAPQGTAKNLIGTVPVPVAAKTGTAQVVQLERQKSNLLERKYVDHSLFIAFLPLDNPTIAVACIVENAGSGSIAAGNIVTKYLTYYLERYPDGT